ncbi:MAG: ATP-binding protein [Deltaproteobacteria bacterium]|nr:ATP-binding protein [Deltaproteobacteria bacterium]
MYPRILSTRQQKSFFLFGPRGVGKTAWLKHTFPEALYFDLLDSDLHLRLTASPRRLDDLIPQNFTEWVILDEVQRIPDILNEVHRLIEGRRLRFILTGSSARKLRRRGVNLLAGRAVTQFMHPLTATELGGDFRLAHSLQFGCLPVAYTEPMPKAYLSSYVSTYLREEVVQEGLLRNVAAFTRFLEAASFSQAAVLNMATVARECGVERKAVEDYFTILEDLLLAVRLPVFTRRAKRRMITHPKFFLFDVGVFNTLRPRGPLDLESEMAGPGLETLILQHLRALNDYYELGYQISYWRTANKVEVDFVLYGEHGLLAIEAKLSARVRDEDMQGLRLFLADYPQAKAYLLYTGSQSWHDQGVEIMNVETALRQLPNILRGENGASQKAKGKGQKAKI